MAGKAGKSRIIRPSALGAPSLGSRTALGQISRRKEPENFEFSFPTLNEYLTPNEQFYVRSHFSKPAIKLKSWRLRVEGAVEKEVAFSLGQLMKMPAEKRAVTLECAGNGRVFLAPKVAGDPWELGAVSNAEWTGVRLADVLAQAGLKSEAVEIILVGADEGEPDDPPKPPGKIHYARGVPVSKLDDVLLAYEMNGEALPDSHGAPLRAVVGGWYGMASVKWLTRVVVINRPFRGYFQSVDYSYWEEEAGMPIRVPITEMKVKAQISRPALHEVVPAGSDYRIAGAAWSGDSDVAKVEISTDGGKSYAKAKLLGEAVRHAWRFWEYFWKTPASPGTCTLMARATDSAGIEQPAEREKKYGNYVIWHTLPVEVHVG